MRLLRWLNEPSGVDTRCAIGTMGMGAGPVCRSSGERCKFGMGGSVNLNAHTQHTCGLAHAKGLPSAVVARRRTSTCAAAARAASMTLTPEAGIMCKPTTGGAAPNRTLVALLTLPRGFWRDRFEYAIGCRAHTQRNPESKAGREIKEQHNHIHIGVSV